MSKEYFFYYFRKWILCMTQLIEKMIEIKLKYIIIDT